MMTTRFSSITRVLATFSREESRTRIVVHLVYSGGQMMMTLENIGVPTGLGGGTCGFARGGTSLGGTKGTTC